MTTRTTEFKLLSPEEFDTLSAMDKMRYRNILESNVSSFGERRYDAFRSAQKSQASFEENNKKYEIFKAAYLGIGGKLNRVLKDFEEYIDQDMGKI